MIPIPGRHRGPLPPQIDPGSFLDMVELVESQTFHESQIQAKIDQLSTAYFYVYCVIEAYSIRKVVLALEAEKYILHSETKKYLYGITSHHQRISHVVFEYPDARLEEESSLGSAVNRTIKKILLKSMKIKSNLYQPKKNKRNMVPTNINPDRVIQPGISL